LFFFLYVSLNFPYVAQLCASNLAKHIKKITASFGVDYFLPLPLLCHKIQITIDYQTGNDNKFVLDVASYKTFNRLVFSFESDK